MFSWFPLKLADTLGDACAIEGQGFWCRVIFPIKHNGLVAVCEGRDKVFYVEASDVALFDNLEKPVAKKSQLIIEKLHMTCAEDVFLGRVWAWPSQSKHARQLTIFSKQVLVTKLRWWDDINAGHFIPLLFG